MIPQLLHRIWFGDDMPEEFVRYGRQWRDLHDAWLYTEWPTGHALPPLPEVYHRADEIAPKDALRFRADVLRLAILWEYGGVYVDTDVEPIRPLDDLLAGVECFASYSPHRSKDGQRLLTNCVMGSVPKHPFIGACIAGLEEAVAIYGDRPLAQMVGPWHLSRVHKANPDLGLTVFHERTFSPQNNRERDAGLEPDLSESYAWHKWATSRDRKR